MSFSIIIPAFNAQNELAQTIDSILCQIDNLDVEIIVVDDGSTDETLKVANAFYYTNENLKDIIKIISQSNKGASAARNAGLKLASKEFVIFLDADDLLPNGTLKHYKEIFDKENVDFISGVIAEFDTDLPPPPQFRV